jgi:hypothetical protein
LRPITLAHFNWVEYWFTNHCISRKIATYSQFWILTGKSLRSVCLFFLSDWFFLVGGILDKKIKIWW